MGNQLRVKLKIEIMINLCLTFCVLQSSCSRALCLEWHSKRECKNVLWFSLNSIIHIWCRPFNVRSNTWCHLHFHPETTMRPHHCIHIADKCARRAKWHIRFWHLLHFQKQFRFRAQCVHTARFNSEQINSIENWEKQQIFKVWMTKLKLTNCGAFAKQLCRWDMRALLVMPSIFQQCTAHNLQ